MFGFDWLIGEDCCTLCVWMCGGFVNAVYGLLYISVCLSALRLLLIVGYGYIWLNL